MNIYHFLNTLCVNEYFHDVKSVLCKSLRLERQMPESLPVCQDPHLSKDVLQFPLQKKTREAVALKWLPNRAENSMISLPHPDWSEISFCWESSGHQCSKGLISTESGSHILEILSLCLSSLSPTYRHPSRVSLGQRKETGRNIEKEVRRHWLSMCSMTSSERGKHNPGQTTPFHPPPPLTAA